MAWGEGEGKRVGHRGRKPAHFGCLLLVWPPGHPLLPAQPPCPWPPSPCGCPSPVATGPHQGRPLPSPTATPSPPHAHRPLGLASPSPMTTHALPHAHPLPGTCRRPRPAHAWPSPQGTDSESEDTPPQHSFVNHYMSDPTYYNSWKRRAPGGRAPHRYEAVAGGEAGPHLHTVVTTQSAVFAPAGPGARTPLTGFSSFV